MNLPNGERADLGAKLEDYVLNPLHREGQHKAHLFASVLGSTSANAQVLRNALLDAAARRAGERNPPALGFSQGGLRADALIRPTFCHVLPFDQAANAAKWLA